MNLVDSSAWLEYFGAGPQAGRFARVIEDVESVLVPTIVLVEVCRRVMQQRGEDEALQVAAMLHQGQVVELDSGLALRHGVTVLNAPGLIDAGYRDELKVVTKLAPTEAQFADLLFAWKVAKFVKSNAIVYAKDNRTIGVGAGQMSRVYSARIAGIKAADVDLVVDGSVMASDAFFPFRDGIDAAAQAGIKAVIQPGGSMRDAEVIAAADEHGIAMVFTGVRHFRH